MHDFDKHFENFDRNFNRVRRFSFVAIIINVFLGLGFIGALVWVAVHFLKKVW